MKKFLAVLLVIALICAGIFVGKKIAEKKLTETKVDEVTDTKYEQVSVEEPEPEINIFKGKDRPIAFMIDNNVNAQPQSSINAAYLVYEIIVEGKETRLMALFKGVDANEVGPMRSSRHYFLDYAMENDAIYAHLGWSPFAIADIATYGINNINGQDYDTGAARTSTSLYWRSQSRKAPHNAYTSIDSILKISAQKGYRTTSDKKSVLNYVPDEVILDSDDSMEANTIVIPYAATHKVKYVYDKDTGRYTRYSKGKLISDLTTGEATTMKNIIITFAKNYQKPEDTENKDRQEVITVGELDGYYITNGRAIKIKCNKSSRNAQTEYVDLEGNEIKVNDGNTWINICPIDANVTID